jgi:hypothetical protein
MSDVEPISFEHGMNIDLEWVADSLYGADLDDEPEQPARNMPPVTSVPVVVSPADADAGSASVAQTEAISKPAAVAAASVTGTDALEEARADSGAAAAAEEEVAVMTSEQQELESGTETRKSMLSHRSQHSGLSLSAGKVPPISFPMSVSLSDLGFGVISLLADRRQKSLSGIIAPPSERRGLARSATVGTSIKDAQMSRVATAIMAMQPVHRRSISAQDQRAITPVSTASEAKVGILVLVSSVVSESSTGTGTRCGSCAPPFCIPLDSAVRKRKPDSRCTSTAFADRFDSHSP